MFFLSSRLQCSIGACAIRAAALMGMALATAACSTTQDRAAQKQAEVAHMMAVYGPACARLGFTANSDPWRNCILNLSTKDDLQRASAYPDYYYSGWGPYWRGSGWGGW
jgi:hypothetical protein